MNCPAAKRATGGCSMHFHILSITKVRAHFRRLVPLVFRLFLCLTICSGDGVHNLLIDRQRLLPEHSTWFEICSPYTGNYVYNCNKEESFSVMSGPIIMVGFARKRETSKSVSNKKHYP